MSSEILKDDQLSPAPMAWRMVAGVGLPAARRSTSEQMAGARLDEVRREAFAEGLTAGRQQAEEQIRPAMEGLAEVLAELARLRSVVRQEAIEDLVRLAVSIAGRVIHREVAIDPDALAGLIQAALSKVQSREISRVRMHPALEGLVRRVAEQSGAPRNLVLVPEPGLKPGEVYFETAQGILDASVETQLREIERGLIDKLER